MNIFKRVAFAIINVPIPTEGEEIRTSQARPVAIKQWHSIPERVAALREQLHTPIVTEAMSTLKESMRPHARAMTTDDSVNSKSFAYYAGYCDALDDLMKLSYQKKDFVEIVDETNKHESQTNLGWGE